MNKQDLHTNHRTSRKAFLPIATSPLTGFSLVDPALQNIPLFVPLPQLQYLSYCLPASDLLIIKTSVLKTLAQLLDGAKG